MLKEATLDHVELQRDFKNMLLESVRTGKPVTCEPGSPPFLLTEAQVHARAAVYLLGEFRDYDALPILNDIYNRGERVLPVPRLFVFAVMDKLVRSYPRTSLKNRRSRRLLDEYLKAVKDLPAGRDISVPSWNAEFTESDFRHQYIGLPLPFESQPHVVLTLYPEELSQFEYGAGLVQEEFTTRYFEPLDQFIQSAFPRGQASE